MLSSEIIALFICISPLIVGWIGVALLLGILGGWRGGLRLILLGLGMLGVFLAFCAVLSLLPDWLAVTLLLLNGVSPWVLLLRYFVMQKLGGGLSLSLGRKPDKWSGRVVVNDPSLPRLSLLNKFTLVTFTVYLILNLPLHLRQLSVGLVSEKQLSVVLIELIQFAFVNVIKLVSPAKIDALGIMLVLLGLFELIGKIHSAQIREKGILMEMGNFYRWENIESYTWKFGEDRLRLKLKRSFFKRDVDLKIPSQFRPQVVAYLDRLVQAGEQHPALAG